MVELLSEIPSKKSVAMKGSLKLQPGQTLGRQKQSVAQKVRMGKKVEKALSKDKNPSSATQQEEDNPNKTPEPYKCIGNFLTDFTELCKQNGMAVIPPVVTRPRPPVATTITNEGKPDKKEKNKQPIPEPEPEPELNEDGEPVEPPPKTYSTKDKFDYFKPSVQVELDNNDKWDTVSEIFIRGWKVDAQMMDVFHHCWTTLDKLHTINLWNTGLTEETVHLLATFLPQCSSIRNLVLDGNPVKEENWWELLGEESHIQSLSLRHCKVTDKGATSLGRALGTAKTANTKLVSLNLTGNLVGDEGAESLADGLRMNRTLMSLALTSNNIGDKGAKKIAEALSRFPLSHDEVVERRRLVSDRGSPDRNKSESKGGKEDTKTIKKEKEDTRGGKRAAGSNDTDSPSVAADATKTVGKTKDKKKDKGKSAHHESEDTSRISGLSHTKALDAQDFINPLLEVADYMDGQLWVAGNRMLINLNLSRNKIDEEGMAALLRAMQYQTTLTLDSRSGGTGLMRLLVNRNVLSHDSDVLRKLNENMLPKDPFYKPPITPEGEAV